MKKLTVIAAGLLLLVPSLTFSDTFSLRFGYFIPGASTNILTHPDSLWAIEFDQMSFNKNKFQGSMLGLSYEYFVTKNVSLAITLDSYAKNRPGYYVDYGQFDLEEGAFAFPYEYYDAYIVEHAFSVSSTPLQLSVKFLPLGRKTRIIPFIGGGAGLYFYSVKLQGEIIDFSDPWIYPDDVLGDITVYPVLAGQYAREKGSTFGYHAFGGFQIPIGFRATIDAEARYHWAKAKFDEWFQDFEDFDLGGLAVTLGFSFWF
jgi:hypothetical protein